VPIVSFDLGVGSRIEAATAVFCGADRTTSSGADAAP
jgi:hypothetical protein